MKRLNVFRFSMLGLILIFLVLCSQGIFAQDFAQPTPEDPVVQTATQFIVQATQSAETLIAATFTQSSLNVTTTAQVGTQAVIDATANSLFETQSAINATTTADYIAGQTATARPTSTPSYPMFTVLLTADPRITTGSYRPGDELTFTINIWNSGTVQERRSILIEAIYDPAALSAPVEGSVSENGQASAGTVSWTLEEGLFPGEDSGRTFTFKAKVNSDLRASADGTIQVMIRNRGGVLLNQSEVMRIPVLVEGQSQGTVSVPQGTGLFQSEGSFALLIGLFFGIGGLVIVGLSGLVIYRSGDDETRTDTFKNTAEILLLLIVLFSVIVMGVQNAIDRESINAIIGGIVGYVAGRTRINLPKGVIGRVGSDTGQVTISGGTPENPTETVSAQSTPPQAPPQPTTLPPSPPSKPLPPSLG